MAGDKRPLIMGLDLGTTGVKAGVIDASGRVLATSTVEYATSTPRPGWAEQDPSDWWGASAVAMRAALSSPEVSADDVVGIGVSGQMHGSVFLDEAREVVRPCILWCDQRTERQCHRITERIGAGNLARLVGNPALPGFTAPKILWLEENERSSFERVTKVILPKDYINLRLTGRLATEVSDASGTLLFDVRARTWSDEMLEQLGLSRDLLVDVLESSERLGSVTAQAAGATGLREGTAVAAGGADNACGALGMGVAAEGQVAVSIGSSGTVLAPTSTARVDPGMRLHAFCHAAPDTWYLMGVMLSAGLSLRWFRDEMGEPEVTRAAAAGKDAYELFDETAAGAPPGCEGMTFLPYLSGERTPHADPNARGVLFGIDLTKRRSHIVRAVMEGVTFGLDDSISLMKEMGVPLETVVAGGGGSRSRLWKQMQADVFELPIRAAGVPDAAMLGAALLGGVASGIYPTVTDACSAAVSYAEEFVPDLANLDAYRTARARYRKLYPALKPLF
jgi:xylulokinase